MAEKETKRFRYFCLSLFCSGVCLSLKNVTVMKWWRCTTSSSCCLGNPARLQSVLKAWVFSGQVNSSHNCTCFFVLLCEAASCSLLQVFLSLCADFLQHQAASFSKEVLSSWIKQVDSSNNLNIDRLALRNI